MIIGGDLEDFPGSRPFWISTYGKIDIYSYNRIIYYVMTLTAMLFFFFWPTVSKYKDFYVIAVGRTWSSFFNQNISNLIIVFTLLDLLVEVL